MTRWLNIAGSMTISSLALDCLFAAAAVKGLERRIIIISNRVVVMANYKAIKYSQVQCSYYSSADRIPIARQGITMQWIIKYCVSWTQIFDAERAPPSVDERTSSRQHTTRLLKTADDHSKTIKSYHGIPQSLVS